MGIPSRAHLYQTLTRRQLAEWERLYHDQPWTADSVSETVARLGAIWVNMQAAKSSPTAVPNHFRAVPRPTETKPEEITVADLAARMGGSL